jgi:hypothetical protein
MVDSLLVIEVEWEGTRDDKDGDGDDERDAVVQTVFILFDVLDAGASGTLL